MGQNVISLLAAMPKAIPVSPQRGASAIADPTTPIAQSVTEMASRFARSNPIMIWPAVISAMPIRL